MWSRWLDTTPMSRIITRCSQDIATVDSEMPNIIFSIANLVNIIVSISVTVVAMAGWAMFLPSLSIVVLGLALGNIYLTAQLPVKRLMSNAKAPVLAHVQAMLIGLGKHTKCFPQRKLIKASHPVSVRAYGASLAFQKEMRVRMDRVSSISHPVWDINKYDLWSKTRC